MGVDISGKNPIIRSEKPKFPSNELWNEMSEEAKDEFWKLDREFRENNPGDYFRSNWWGWRPIVGLCEMASLTKGLNIDFNFWGSNDGAGLETQEECNELANALEELSSEFFDNQDVDELQICMGSWTTLQGRFVDSEIQENLNNEHEFGTILTSPIVVDGGTIVKSSHSVNKEHLQGFIAFLRECGGFEIW